MAYLSIEKKINPLEYLFTIFSLVLYTGGIINIVALDGLSESQIDYDGVTNDSDRFILVKILYPLTYIISLLLLTRSFKKSTKVSRILMQNIYLLLIVGLTIISAIWSELPFLTISRSMALVGTTIFGIYLSDRYSLKQQLVLLNDTFLLIILMSIIFTFGLSKYGIMEGIHSGAWRGIYTHKNEFGRLMSLSTIIFIIQSQQKNVALTTDLKDNCDLLERCTLIEIGRNSNTWLQNLSTYLGLYLSILLLILSRSFGAIVELTTMLILLGIFKIGRLRPPKQFLAILGTITLFCISTTILIGNSEKLLAQTGKGLDLSGRGDLWEILLGLLSTSPFLGFGYGAFWERYRSVVALEAGWRVPDAHNGFLDLTLSIGMLGLILFLIGYFHTFLKRFSNFYHSQNNEETYPLMLLSYILISNISETGLLAHNNIYWLFYVTVSYSVIELKDKYILAPPKSLTI
jgi:exopolysaccharide production protein ExoQ